jgi:hypothetical protein
VLNEEHGKHGINVIQADGEKPWTAICRGAVYKGFLDSSSIPIPGPQPVEIVSKVSRMHLGYRCEARFDEDVHDGSTKRWDSDEKCYFARDQMKWLVRKGEDITTKSEARGELYRTYEEDDFTDNFTERLWQCEDNAAPQTYTADSVQSLCTITFEIKKRWKDLADLVDSNGQKVKGKKKLEYSVVMIPSGSSVDFVILIDGERQASQSVNIEFERGD